LDSFQQLFVSLSNEKLRFSRKKVYVLLFESLVFAFISKKSFSRINSWKKNRILTFFIDPLIG
jgi:hypothetical protein